MDIGSVCRIHEANDAVVDAAGQVGSEIGELVLVTESRDARGGLPWIRTTRKSCASGAGLGNENPEKIVVLLTGVASRVDAVDFEFLGGGERWNQLALAGVSVEPPAMIAALELRAAKVAAGERHSPMRAGVLKSEGPALRIASQDQRDFEQHSFLHPVAAYAVRRQRAVPEAGKHERIGSLPLRGFVEHGMGRGYYRGRSVGKDGAEFKVRNPGSSSRSTSSPCLSCRTGKLTSC